MYALYRVAVLDGVPVFYIRFFPGIGSVFIFQPAQLENIAGVEDGVPEGDKVSPDPLNFTAFQLFVLQILKSIPEDLFTEASLRIGLPGGNSRLDQKQKPNRVRGD